MTEEYQGPLLEDPEPLESEDASEAAGLDSEVDFDDEADEDQQPLDLVEAIEAGAMLDDPEEDPDPDAD